MIFPVQVIVKTEHWIRLRLCGSFGVDNTVYTLIREVIIPEFEKQSVENRLIKILKSSKIKSLTRDIKLNYGENFSVSIINW